MEFANCYISPVLTLTAALYEHINGVKANKERCELLKKRVKGLESVLQHVKEEHLKNSLVRDTIMDLQDILMAAVKLVQQHADTNWLQQAMDANSLAEEFNDINSRLSGVLNQLSVSLHLEQLDHVKALREVFLDQCRIEKDQEETDVDKQNWQRSSADVPPPGPIQFESVQSDSVSLRWSPPEGAPGQRTFKVTWIGSQKHHKLMVTDMALEVTGLTPGEKYNFSVVTLCQDGRQSTPVEGAAYTEVPPPQNLQVEVKSLTAGVTWTKPAGVDQVTYLLKIIKNHEYIRAVHRDSCQYTLTGLQAAADYTINVTTVVSNGRQSQPASKLFTTGREAFTLVLLGKSGSGKSASGNTIMGENIFRSRPSYKAITTQCEERSKDFYGTQLNVIDTPDFFDKDCGQQIGHVVECRQMCEGRECVYLLVIQIGRFAVEDKDILERLETALQTRIRDRTVILFTHGDALKSRQSIDDYVRKANEHLQVLIGKCGYRYDVFNNKERKAAMQQMSLMRKIAALVNDTEGCGVFSE